MKDYSYEEITESEADFIIRIYEAIKKILESKGRVTLVRLGYELNVRPSELSDYLFQIVKIEEYVESEIRKEEI